MSRIYTSTIQFYALFIASIYHYLFVVLYAIYLRFLTLNVIAGQEQERKRGRASFRLPLQARHFSQENVSMGKNSHGDETCPNYEELVFR